MKLSRRLKQITGNKKIKVWVLAPYLKTDDEQLKYYYDFTQSIAEYTKVFEKLKLQWVWQPVALDDYQSVIKDIQAEQIQGEVFPVVLNLCDGDEVNGTPGLSVVKVLELSGLVFTGSDSYFYDVTTSKVSMKKAFDAHNVSHAPWKEIKESNPSPAGIFKRLGSPLIVKPAVSGGSLGVGIKNVVSTPSEMKEEVKKLFNGYRGWEFGTGGVIAEKFITGPEFTTLIVGSYDQPDKLIYYTPVERVFNASLPDTEKFLSFERLWEIYENETSMPEQGNFYEYKIPSGELHEAIEKITKESYIAVQGKGYGRIDIRMDQETGQMYVLEVNAQCGLSDDENFTSIGAILRYSNKTFDQLIQEILMDALESAAVKELVLVEQERMAL
jgi:D-alanine-D-alanine ligase